MAAASAQWCSIAARPSALSSLPQMNVASYAILGAAVLVLALLMALRWGRVLLVVLLLLATGPVAAMFAFRFFATTEQPPGPYLLGLPAALLLAAGLAIVLCPSRSETDRGSTPERDRQEPHL
jgi:hypothetical protein